MRLAELIDKTDAREAGEPVDAGSVVVTQVTDDSREVSAGGLFVARAGVRTDGTRADGARFIAKAIERGARVVLAEPGAIDQAGISGDVVVLESERVARTGAVLAERFAGCPTRELQLVGITGTNGKTTTTHLVWQLLNAVGVACGQIGTVEIDAGDGIERARMTTPGAVELSNLMSRMVANGKRACVMEVSSHALDQERVGGLRFDVGVFTNLSGEHLDYHKTMDAYAGAKRKLFEMLPEGAVGIVNADDPRGRVMLAAARGGGWACSMADDGADWFVRTVSSDVAGTELQIRGPAYTITRRTALAGGYNAMNACQALASADEVLARLGWSVPERARRLGAALAGVTPPLGRMERVASGPGQPTVIVDYAHTDDAIERALSSLRETMAEHGKLTIVFGPGGDKDPSKRPRMGRVAAEGADVVVLTSDNPRTEPIERIFGDVLEGVPSEARDRVVCVPDRARAIRKAIEGANAGDVVVLAGKGHEREQVYADGAGGTRREVFSDPDVARGVLAELDDPRMPREGAG